MKFRNPWIDPRWAALVLNDMLGQLVDSAPANSPAVPAQADPAPRK
jgi:hypothetical protein